MSNLAHETAGPLAPGQDSGEPSHEETLALLNAFMKINDTSLREMIVELVERLTEKPAKSRRLS